MLLHMHINNFILIDDLKIDLEDGLNILTGETGAGKSIIIGSLAIGLGGKYSRESLRDPNKDGFVELLFSINDASLMDKLSTLDIDVSDGELIISRRLTSTGKTINKINDNTVTTAKIKEVASLLIDLHAQHEQQTLLKMSKHLAILDDYGKDKIEVAKLKVAEAYREYHDILDKINEEAMDEAKKNKQQDFLNYQISEIKAAKLKEGEDEELESVYKKMNNSQEILSLANNIYSVTGYSHTGAGDAIGRAVSEMKKICDLDGDVEGAYSILSDVDAMLNDFNTELKSYMESMDFDEDEFREIEQRLDLINSLKAKYGKTYKDIMNNLSNYEEEYNKLVSYDEYMEKLSEALAKAEKKLKSLSDELTLIRKNKAIKLCKLIKASLEELNFLSVEFGMEISELEDYTANGKDQAYFTISTNVGEPLRPLYDVASGGELSRVMLAIKSSLANVDDTPTLIFDEIDVGISGRTAQKVAEKMSIIGRSHQVICITHLAQIASMADNHYVIEKNVVNNKTITNIRRLNKSSSVEELARLLGGAEITESTLTAAREMKELADKTKLN